jgi:hypothetical protein
MRKKFMATVTAATLTVGALATLTTPASASDGPGSLCTTADATPVYANRDFTGYLFTLSAGRGFRAHELWGNDSGVIGYFGHGSERPDRDGYVRGQHLPGC